MAFKVHTQINKAQFLFKRIIDISLFSHTLMIIYKQVVASLLSHVSRPHFALRRKKNMVLFNY